MRRTQLARTLRSEFVPPAFTHGPVQWGVVETVHAGPPPTVDVYLDGTQTLANTEYLTIGIRYMAWYSPVVGDVVLLSRGAGGLKTDRVVLGTLQSGEPSTLFAIANATATTAVATGGTTVKIPMASLPYSNGGFTIGTGGNIGLVILPWEGLYDIDAAVEANSTSAAWVTMIYVNGTVALGKEVAGQSVSGLVRASATGQTLGLYASQTTGSSVTVGDDTTGTFLHVQYLGPA